MATCKECDDDVDFLVMVNIAGKKMKLCEDCAERAEEAAVIAGEAARAMQDMMGYKGRR